MSCAPGATARQVDISSRADWGRFTDPFGKIHNVFFITADTMRYDIGRLTPLDFVFIDGGHGDAVVRADERVWIPQVAPGGLLAIHDVFPDPAAGGRPPFELYRRFLDGGAFPERDELAEGSLRLLARREP